jgi:hypothetical protein
MSLRVRSDVLRSACTFPELGEFQFIYAELGKPSFTKTVS